MRSKIKSDRWSVKGIILASCWKARLFGGAVA